MIYSCVIDATDESKIREEINHGSYGVKLADISSFESNNFGKDVFQRNKEDEKPGMTVDSYLLRCTSKLT